MVEYPVTIRRFTRNIYDFILDEAGVVVENEQANEGDVPRAEEGNIKGRSEDELRGMLEKALEKEDYETAAKIRDELKRLEG